MENFKDFLLKKGFLEEKTREMITLAQRFEKHLEGREPRADDVHSFSKLLMTEGKNNWDTYVGLVQYGRFHNYESVILTGIEIIDGSEALDNLSEKVKEECGEDVHSEIFADMSLPPIGSPTAERPAVTQVVMERLTASCGTQGCHNLLKDCLRDLEKSWFSKDREKYLQAGSLDAFLPIKGNDYIADLSKIMEEDGFYFTQKINQGVIDFVDQQPEIRQGVRKGNILYETKIPYLTIKYLAAEDKTQKRFYGCHCPWARTSIIDPEVDVPASFCDCSAGFHKFYWETVLDQPLEAEVVESILAGDLRCRFAIKLPKGV